MSAPVDEHDLARRPLARALNALGALAICVLLVRWTLPGRPVWVWIVALVPIAAWLLHAALPARVGLRPRIALLLTMCVGVVALPIAGVNPFIAGYIAIGVLIASPAIPLGWGAGAAIVSAAAISIGAAAVGTGVAEFLSVLAGIAIAALLGLSRRQYRAREQQSRELLRERAETAALAERQRIAGDLHDVLAHSLGGLVIQLDAVEALLEAGRAESALERARFARDLAAAGLAEARLAVGALRDGPQADVPWPELRASLDELVSAHRALGGRARLAVTGAPVALAATAAGLVRSVLREALTNARKHAPRSTVEIALAAEPGRLRLEVVSSTGGAEHPALGPSGGGLGLAGLGERAAAVAGAEFEAGTDAAGDAFRVRVAVPVAVAAEVRR